MVEASTPTPEEAIPSVLLPEALSPFELGWLTGTLDGEGSVGLTRHLTTIRPQVQVNTTCGETAAQILALYERLGVRGRGYVYQEKKPDRHRPSHLVTASRLIDCYRLAEAVGPGAVTKREQWRVVLEFCELRLSRAEVDELGRVRRGGDWRTRNFSYGAREHALYEEIRDLNRRGPRAARAA